MKVGVLGLWHLGSVTAACMASKGHEVIGIDPDQSVIKRLSQGEAPIYEPGLNELLKDSITAGSLKFCDVESDTISEIEVLWVSYDTPVDDNDEADSSYVINQTRSVFPLLPKNTLVLISSQLPVGSVEWLEVLAGEDCPELKLRFACLPENLRLGEAISVFNNPDRIVVGIRDRASKETLTSLLSPITTKIVWMSVESAEMTKHAINAFLATSIAFTNEIATICESVGANGKEVERGLKSETRIGRKAYVSPGGPFAGGTLARDIGFLHTIGANAGLATPVLSSVSPSNDEHKNWVRRKLLYHFGDLKGKKIGIWGLTYKPGTDTLRRSLSIELCDWVLSQGGQINVFDPAVKELPNHWTVGANRCNEALDVLLLSEALVVATEWPEFKEEKKRISAFLVNKSFPVFDANGFLEDLFSDTSIQFYTVGVSNSFRGT